MPLPGPFRGDPRSMQAATAPAISVLMPAYNAEGFVRQSVQSVLAQTFEDFELLVVNDGSTDATRDILAGIDDPRLRIIDNPRNLGIVGTLNHGLQHARARYIARLDSDDFCLPHRFARQKAFLDSHPETVIVAAEMSVLEDGNVTFTRDPGDPEELVVEWLLHLGNPVGHTSMMFRAETVAAMGSYLREEFTYAEDFDFSHRMLRHGRISILPEHLVIYRKHLTNLTRTKRDTMLQRTGRVLRDAYGRLLGPGHDADADLVTEHLIARGPFTDDAAPQRLGAFLARLVDGFALARNVSAAHRERLEATARRAWWRMIQAQLRGGEGAQFALRHRGAFPLAGRPNWREMARSIAVGLAGERLRQLRRRQRPPQLPAPELRIDGVAFRAAPNDPHDPPCLHVVVDTEAAFDRTEGFDRSRTAVTGMREQEPAQQLFESLGVRPLYLVDHAVASQPEGYGPLREMQDRHACVIGALMQARITPPFEGEEAAGPARGGIPARDLEERKLRSLIAAIRQNFGIAPLFFRAAHHGFGPDTMDLLAELGFQVDFSLLPHADLRARGGPDFRLAECVPYRVSLQRLLCVPVARGQIGALAPMSPRLQRLVQHPVMDRLQLPGLLARLNLADTVTLTPEGVTSEDQIRLIDAMMARGCRTFVLHYHSPSLAMRTPYVRTDAERAEFLRRIDAVCRHFLRVRGGMPGHPADLLPPGMRSRLWPQGTHAPTAEAAD